MLRVFFVFILLVFAYYSHAENSTFAHSFIQSPKKTRQKNDEVLLRADDVSYEKGLGLVIARGNVQVSDGIDVLEADTVTYNKKLNMVSASGNVRLYKHSGELITGSYVELTEDLKKGFIDKIYLITADEERFAASKGFKDDHITTMEKGVYSPCKLCKADKNAPFTWQIRATKIIRDEESMDVSYRNLILDFKGIPGFYFPYFKHPDPSVERRTGLLMPTFANASELGTTLIAPFYWDINAQQDVTLRPVFMSKEGVLLGGDYRGLFTHGFVNVSASTIKTNNITGAPGAQKTNPTEYHGHLSGITRFDLTENWRFKANGTRVTSPTYFRRYYFVEGGRFYGDGTLDSQGFFEGFYDKNYIAFGGYDFQNLRAEVNNKTVPVVTPVVKADYQSDTDAWGGSWKTGLDQNYVTRPLGTKVGRVSSWGNYTLPYISAAGTTHKAQAEIRGALYDIRSSQSPVSQRPVRQTRGRVIPTLTLDNGYPLVQYFDKNALILEPILGAVISSNNMNDPKIPNEDSQDFEFDTTNVMKKDRFPGFDRIDGGQRLNYGVNFNLYGDKSKQLFKGFVGQSYSFSKENQFPQYSGIYKGQSDFVSALGTNPHPYFSANWSSRFDKKTFRLRKSLLQAMAGPPIFQLHVDYIMIDRQFLANQFVKREQITTSVHSCFHENWNTYIKVTKELGYKPGDLEHGAGLMYQDDCFFSKLDLFRTFYNDRDIKPSKTIMLTLGFKNLGTYSTGRLNLNTLGETIPEDPNAPKTVGKKE